MEGDEDSVTNQSAVRDVVTSIIKSNSERAVRRRSFPRSENGEMWSKSRYEGKADDITMKCLDVLIPAICQVSVEDVRSNLQALASLKPPGATESSKYPGVGTGCKSFPSAAGLSHLSRSSNQTCGASFSFSGENSYKTGMATPFQFSSGHRQTRDCSSATSDDAAAGERVMPVTGCESFPPAADLSHLTISSAKVPFVFGSSNQTHGAPFSFSGGNSYKTGMATPFQFSSGYRQTRDCSSATSGDAAAGERVMPVTGCESFLPAADLSHLTISSAKVPFVFGSSNQTRGAPFSFSGENSYKTGMATPFQFSSGHRQTRDCSSATSGDVAAADDVAAAEGATSTTERTASTAFVFGATSSTMSGSCDSRRRQTEKKLSTRIHRRKPLLNESISPGGGERDFPIFVSCCDESDTSLAGLSDASFDEQTERRYDVVELCVDSLYECIFPHTIIEMVKVLDVMEKARIIHDRNKLVLPQQLPSRLNDYKQARVSSKPDTHCTCAGSANQHPCICAYVNFVCPLSGLSLLHFAVMAKNAEIVEELLSWGADTDVTNQEACSGEEVLPPLFQGISPLYMAVAMGSCEVVRKLIGAGAKPHIAKCLRSGAHISTWELAMGNHDIFNVLLNNPDKNRIPVRYAVMSKMFGCSEVQDIDFVQRSLWNPCCLVNWDLCRTIGTEDNRELNQLLLADPKTRQEKLVKALYVQSFLEGICNKNRRLNYGSLRLPTVVYHLLLNGGLDKCRGWHKSVVAVLTSICKELIEEELNADLGAGKCYLAGEVVSGSMHGRPLRDEIWTNDPAGIVCEICLERVRQTHKVSRLPYLENTSYSSTGWVDELSSPCLLPAAVRYGSLGGGNRPDIGEDKALQLLIEAAKLSWLPNVEALPTERDGYHVLHDGPTCHDHVELSPEQHRISLLMCSSSGSTLYSLQESCRHAVLSCIRPPNVLSSIEKLPLPASLIDFLLLG